MLSSRALSAAAALLVAVLGAACGRAPEAFGSTPEAGRANAAEMFNGVASRFHNAQRVGPLENIHRSLTRNVLSPSRLWADSSLWTNSHDSTRSALVAGTSTPTGYELTQRRMAPLPARAGEVHIATALTRLSDSEYQWDANTHYALGKLSVRDFVAGLSASLRELETGDAAAIRERINATLPHSARAFGHAFSIDSLRTVHRADGVTIATIVIGIQPDRAKAKFPGFAEYLDKYISPASYRFTLMTGDGRSVFADARAKDNRLTLLLAIKDGALVSFRPPIQRLPDTLHLRTDLSLHVLVFDVGMRGLDGELTLTRDSTEAGFAIRWRKVPEWRFPLGTEHLVKAPLTRPFAGEGASFAMTLRDRNPTHPQITMLERHVRIVMQESSILRFLSRLGSRAADDFTQRVDQESHRFVSEAFGALAKDVAPRLPRTTVDERTSP